MTDRAKPEVLYKFRSWNDKNHKTLLTENKLWVPSASKLNDPFDCRIPFRYDYMKVSDLKKRLMSLLGSNQTRAERRKQVAQRIHELGFYDELQKVELLEGWTESYRIKQGVLSFATVLDNPLLWSHYADSFYGFCVELDYKRILDLVEI